MLAPERSEFSVPDLLSIERVRRQPVVGEEGKNPLSVRCERRSGRVVQFVAALSPTDLHSPSPKLLAVGDVVAADIALITLVTGQKDAATHDDG